MLRTLYTILISLIQPFLLLIMWNRGRTLPAYSKRLGERYGVYKNVMPPQANGILVHAASVGEVIAATPLIKRIQSDYPDLPITVTTVTPTGSSRVKAAFGDSVAHYYLPYDIPSAMKRFLSFVQPKLIVVIETELWPNFIRQAKLKNIPFVIANARLSPRSAKRYGWIKNAMHGILSEISLIMAQDQVSADRYLSLGFNEKRLVNTGNLKFDLEITDKLRQKVANTAFALKLDKRLVWIAGSTHEGEEELILAAHKQLLASFPDLVLILVPRHPERFKPVEKLIVKSGASYIRRSDRLAMESSHSILLGDTMGEMMVMYGLANVAFVGGSLVKHGGHNPLEPIAYKLPVISGKHTFNFPEIFAKLREEYGVLEVESSEDALAQAVKNLLENTKLCQTIGEAGFAVLKENQGALRRQIALLQPYLEKNQNG